MRSTLPALVLVCVLCGGGCAELCEAEGLDGLAGFDLDCDALEFRIDGAATRITLEDATGGQVELELSPVHTLTQGLRFEAGGEFEAGGNYHDPDAAIAPVDDVWLEITAWESIEGEAFGQRVDTRFHVEVGATSRFVGGQLDGEAQRVPVFTTE